MNTPPDIPATFRTSHASSQPPLPASLVNDDDDEPPSSGPRRPNIPKPVSEHGLNNAALSPPLSTGATQRRVSYVDAAAKESHGIRPNAVSSRLKAILPFRRHDSLETEGNTAIAVPRPTYKASLVATLRYTPLNICLLFIPVSWALHFTHQNDTAVFVTAALGLIPLAALLGLGTEQIALRTTQTIGGLLNASLGNVVELIIAGIALAKCDLQLVQSSLLGGLLSNLLLVLGMAFIVGGLRFHTAEFQAMAAQVNTSLMTLAVCALIVPAAFHEYLGERLGAEEGTVLLKLSRASSIVLILIYIAYLYFQFHSHKSLFIDTIQTSAVARRSDSSDSTRSTIASSTRAASSVLPLPATAPIGTTNEPVIIPGINASIISLALTEREREHIKLNMPAAAVLLVACTALAYYTAECLVDSINGLADSSSVSKEWLTLIVIPIVSNAAEHATAVVVAAKGKFDLALAVAVGSCIQIALFVIPVLVLVAWGLGKPLTLLFDSLETICLFLSIIIVKFAIDDGRSHWMSGVVLVAVYVLIAISFWFFPSHMVATLEGVTCT